MKSQPNSAGRSAISALSQDDAEQQQQETMKMNSLNTEVVVHDDMTDILSDLDLTVGEEASAEDIIEALDEGDTQTIEVLNEKSDAIDGQVSDINADTSTTTEKPARTRKARSTTAKVAKPKIERDLSAIADEFFQLSVSAASSDKAAVIATKPAQVKIGEKFDNLFSSLAAGRKPSVYTMACFSVVAEKGEVTSSDLVAAMKAAASRAGSAYSDGTARSQVGQLMALFDVVGIAKREGNKLTFNKDSKIAERLLA